jgi:SWI/SNF-related matrix-associated actin-dependent regulator 1 of chromatin subfamily A
MIFPPPIHEVDGRHPGSFWVPDCIPKHLTLRPYQLEGVEKCLKWLLTPLDYEPTHPGGFYFADDMGVGKTIEACAVVSALNWLMFETCHEMALGSEEVDTYSVLILTTKSALYNWKEEFLKWCGWFYVDKDISILSGAKFKPARVIITTYDTAKTRLDLIGKPNILIMDESHKLIHSSSQRSQAIFNEIYPYAHFKLALSGTPYRTNVTDGFTLFSRMLPSVFADYETFGTTWSYKFWTPNGPTFKGIRDHEKLTAILRNTFYIRRLKEEVLPDLPPKEYVKVILPEKYGVKIPDHEDPKVVESATRAIVKALEADHEVKLNATLKGLQRAQGVNIAEPVIDFVKDLLEQGIPLVLFAYHKDVLALYREGLKKWKYGYIDGTVSGIARHKVVKDFQEGTTDFVMSQIVAGGEAITVTRASVVVLGEVSYPPAVVSQAVDRVHRSGQKNLVTAYYFSVQGSILDDMNKAVMNVASQINKVQ